MAKFWVHGAIQGQIARFPVVLTEKLIALHNRNE